MHSYVVGLEFQVLVYFVYARSQGTDTQLTNVISTKYFMLLTHIDFMHMFKYQDFVCLFVWFDSLHPINNLSVIKGWIFLD